MKKKRFKRFLSFAGAVAVSLGAAAAVPQNGGAGMFSVTASAAETSKITVNGGTSVPSNIKAGQAVIVKGTVKSSDTLTQVRVGVFDTSGKMVTGNYEKISAASYDLHRLDKYVLFNKLADGEYTYRVYAYTDAGRKLVVKQKFTVGNAKPSAENTGNSASNTTAAPAASASKNISNLTVDGITLKNGTALADHLTKGKGVNVTGVLSADENFSYVTVAVYDIKKKFVTGIKVLPNVNTYDLANTDKYVEFNVLTDGIYYYRVTAAFDDGKEHVLVQKKFAVGSAVLTDEEDAPVTKPVNISEEIDVDEENESDDELVDVQEDVDIGDELDDDDEEEDDDDIEDEELDDEELEDEELDDEELELEDEEVVP